MQIETLGGGDRISNRRYPSTYNVIIANWLRHVVLDAYGDSIAESYARIRGRVYPLIVINAVNTSCGLSSVPGLFVWDVKAITHHLQFSSGSLFRVQRSSMPLFAFGGRPH